MRYQLDVKPGVREYLRSLQFQTREGVVRFYGGMYAVAEVSDAFRADPGNRISAETRRFLYRYAFRDGDRVRLLTLGVDDSAAAYGILAIDYADCT